ncbi:MAG: FkbM family methyltransferase [Betaproteobacteria bacterium]|nr:FkbM family methyltransferase [Betaproteobacteria bacterium]
MVDHAGGPWGELLRVIGELQTELVKVGQEGDCPHSIALRLQGRIDELTIAAEQLTTKAQLASDLQRHYNELARVAEERSLRIAMLESQHGELEARLSALDGEMIRVEAQIAVIKETFRRGGRARPAEMLRGGGTLQTAPDARRSDASADEIPLADAAGLLDAAISDAYDGMLLSAMKSAWYSGDWEGLANVDMTAVAQHPERATITLLIASACEQLAQPDRALRYAHLAFSWGASKALVDRVFVAGAHNSLGRAAALTKDSARAREHFMQAIEIGMPIRIQELASHLRSVREMSRVGLLPQAATLVAEEIEQTTNMPMPPEEHRARMSILQTEMELLQHELSLAQQRQQNLYGAPNNTQRQGLAADEGRWLEALKSRSVSQLGQDLWVAEKTSYKRGGFFVEFGATDGVLLSNSYLLEKEFAWQGICAEPNPKLFEDLKRHRRCIVSNACIGATTGQVVDFIFADAYGGFAKYAAGDNHAEKRAAYATAGHTARLTTISLDDFLVENNAPRVIDYLSIDTEGSELEILSAFPFEKWDVRLITVEHNYTPQRQAIRDLLNAKGYHCCEREWDDWYARD